MNHWPLARRDLLAADEQAVARLELDDVARLGRRRVLPRDGLAVAQAPGRRRIRAATHVGRSARVTSARLGGILSSGAASRSRHRPEITPPSQFWQRRLGDYLVTYVVEDLCMTDCRYAHAICGDWLRPRRCSTDRSIPTLLTGNLRDLARVNRWLGGSACQWRALSPLLRARRVRQLCSTSAPDRPTCRACLLDRARRTASTSRGEGDRRQARDRRVARAQSGEADRPRGSASRAATGSTSQTDPSTSSTPRSCCTTSRAGRSQVLREMARVARTGGDRQRPRPRPHLVAGRVAADALPRATLHAA